MMPRWLIGLASGSSVDGVDAALMELEGVGLDLRVRQVQGLHQSYGQELRALIRRISTSAPCEVRQVSRLHRLLGETFAAAARMAAADSASAAELRADSAQLHRAPTLLSGRRRLRRQIHALLEKRLESVLVTYPEEGHGVRSPRSSVRCRLRCRVPTGYPADPEVPS